MLPLHDENPTRSTPVITFALIAANAAFFFYQLSMGLDVSVVKMGLIPAELVHAADRVYVGGRGSGLPPGLEIRNLEPAWATVFTSMFLHGGWMHILGNMWFLWIFGNNVEDALGKVKYLLFYLACGAAAAGAQTVLNTNSQIPMVGASGALAGIMGAYLVLFPGSRILCLTMFLVITTVELPATVVLGLWFVLELVRGLGKIGSDVGGVAYAAHVGGFVFGWLFIRLMGAHPHARPRRYAPRADIDWR